MPSVPVFELARVRLRAPDLGNGRRFAEAFGLSSRATDAGPHCQIVELGKPAFLGAAFIVKSARMLSDAASTEGAGPIEPTNHRRRTARPSHRSRLSPIERQASPVGAMEETHG